MFSAPIINVTHLCVQAHQFSCSSASKAGFPLHQGLRRPHDLGKRAAHDRRGRGEGGINANESTLIHNVIEFDDLEAIDIFTPRVDVEAIPADSDVEDIAQLFIQTGFSRLPVYEESIDNIIGLINEKDFHNYVVRGGAALEYCRFRRIHPAVDEDLRPFEAAPENKSHLAVIVDEFGGTEGIVTLEDIIEELVGEIWDEHDRVGRIVRKLSENVYLVDCSTDLDEMFAFFGIKAETEASTINGWVIEQLDRIRKGRQLRFRKPASPWRRREYQRTTRVRITVTPKPRRRQRKAEPLLPPRECK